MHLASDHDALLDAMEELVRPSGIDTLLPAVLRAAVRTLAADEGALEINGTRIAWPNQNMEISATAVRQALEQGGTVLWNQDGSGQQIPLSQSITTQGLSSILASPFRIGSEQSESGWIYVQRVSRPQPFVAHDIVTMERFVRICLAVATRLEELAASRKENEQLRGIRREGGLSFASENMAKLVTLAAKAAAMPVPVAIHGETGTGKEMLARFVHSKSSRAEQPFVAVNCGAIPENLVESILFGHVKGAFTGAVENRKGLFEEAEGGSLFLDEVGELPLLLQVKLLRVLQERKVVRVGDSREIPVDVRLLSASHVDLKAAVKEGRFREDLFFRLNVMELVLPPLRERGQDVLLLARQFLEKYAVQFGLESMQFSRAAEKALLRHDWPGNVRELENRVQKSLVQADGRIIQPTDLGLVDDSLAESGLRTLQVARESAERSCIDAAMRDAGGNLTLAGQILGVDRKVLREILERLGMDKTSYRRTEAEI